MALGFTSFSEVWLRVTSSGRAVAAAVDTVGRARIGPGSYRSVGGLTAVWYKERWYKD